MLHISVTSKREMNVKLPLEPPLATLSTVQCHMGCCAPLVFQYLINDNLQVMLGKFFITYINNILIYSLSNVIYINHVKKV